MAAALQRSLILLALGTVTGSVGCYRSHERSGPILAEDGAVSEPLPPAASRERCGVPVAPSARVRDSLLVLVEGSADLSVLWEIPPEGAARRVADVAGRSLRGSPDGRFALVDGHVLAGGPHLIDLESGDVVDLGALLAATHPDCRGFRGLSGFREDGAALSVTCRVYTDDDDAIAESVHLIDLTTLRVWGSGPACTLGSFGVTRGCGLLWLTKECPHESTGLRPASWRGWSASSGDVGELPEPVTLDWLSEHELPLHFFDGEALVWDAHSGDLSRVAEGDATRRSLLLAGSDPPIYPFTSPGGRYLTRVVTRLADDLVEVTGRELRLMSTRPGDSLRTIVRCDGSRSAALSWSPDESRVTFHCDRSEHGGPTLWLVEAARGAVLLETTDTASIALTRWRSDAARFVVLSRGPDRAVTISMRTRDGDELRLPEELQPIMETGRIIAVAWRVDPRPRGHTPFAHYTLD